MTKTFLTEQENALIEEITKDTKKRIVNFIKNKYCLELENIDELVKIIIKNVSVYLTDAQNRKHGNILKEAEKWYLESNIKSEFNKHSVYGFARTMDGRFYSILIPKKKVLTNFKYWLATKLFKIV